MPYSLKKMFWLYFLGNFVVKQKYIHDSYEKRQFLPEELYVPNDVESLRLACMKYGRLFENQTCVILLGKYCDLWPFP